MESINLSEDYKKLPEHWEKTEAYLLSVIPCNLKEIKAILPEFISYDTIFYSGKIEQRYPLNFKYALILVFIHKKTGRVFTTIRRDHNHKFEHYRSSIGGTFKLVRTKRNIREVSR